MNKDVTEDGEKVITRLRLDMAGLALKYEWKYKKDANWQDLDPKTTHFMTDYVIPKCPDYKQMDVVRGQPGSALYERSVSIPKTVNPPGRNRIESNREEQREVEKAHLIRYPLGLYSRKTPNTEMITIENDDSGSSRESSVTNLSSYLVVASNKERRFLVPRESAHNFLVKESSSEDSTRNKRKSRDLTDDEEEEDDDNEILDCTNDTPNQTEDDEEEEAEMMEEMQDALKKVTLKNKASNATKNKIPKTKEKQQELLAALLLQLKKKKSPKKPIKKAKRYSKKGRFEAGKNSPPSTSQSQPT